MTPVHNAQPDLAFRRLLVRGLPNYSATHAMPDADECASPAGSGNPPLQYGPYFNTCSCSYTTETKFFFEEHADLNLNP